MLGIKENCRWCYRFLTYHWCFDIYFTYVLSQSSSKQNSCLLPTYQKSTHSFPSTYFAFTSSIPMVITKTITVRCNVIPAGHQLHADLVRNQPRPHPPQSVGHGFSIHLQKMQLKVCYSQMNQDLYEDCEFDVVPDVPGRRRVRQKREFFEKNQLAVQLKPTVRSVGGVSMVVHLQVTRINPRSFSSL